MSATSHLGGETDILFETSSLLATSFPVTILELLTDEDIAANDRSYGPQGHNNFIRLLQHAANCQTAILPLTWEPAFEKLGRDGLVGTVDQNLLNSEVSLAFKRFKARSSNPRQSIREFRDQQYEAMINEITVLSHPALTEHNNIIEFVGLCFELVSVEGEVWPVLVFAKSNQGDLGSFRDRRQHLDEKIMFGIIGQVASGIRVLHSNSIAHGDLKPSNILIAESQAQDAVQVTLADFGFSRYGEAEDSLVRLSRSEPWEAPEWTHHRVSLFEAKKMDMYSFGLLCLWLFFGNETLPSWDLHGTALQAAFTKQDDEAFEELQVQKRNGNHMLQLAETLVKTSSTYSTDAKQLLQRVFALLLVQDPDERHAVIEDVIKILADDPETLSEYTAPTTSLVDTLDWHGSLQMHHLFFAFESCDYRVHLFLTQSLAQVAEGNGCDVCSDNAMVQLAFCRAIGFGTEHTMDKKYEFMDRADIEAEVKEGINRVNNDHRKQDIIMARLASLGYRHDFAFIYERDGVLAEAIEYYGRALAKRKIIFEPGHFSTLRLLGLLLTLLRHADRFEEATEVAAELENFADKTVSVDQVEVKTQLVRLLNDRGEFEAAESLAREVCDIYSRMPSEEKSSERLDSQKEWARALVQVKNFDHAIKIAKDTLEACLIDLSELHATTIATRRWLARAYDGSGELQLSKDMNKALVRAERRLESESDVDPKLVEDAAILGVQCYQTGEQEDAKSCYEEVHRLIRKRVGMAKHAAIAINNYTIRLINRGDSDTALSILTPLLTEVKRVMSPSCEEAGLVMGNLAYIYSQRASYQEAEPLERQVLEIRRRTIGDSHVNTITAFGALRLTLIAQERYDEAVEIAEEELNAAAGMKNSSLNDTVRAAETIAVKFFSTDAFSQALPFFEYEQRLQECDMTETVFTSLPSMACTAICYLHLRNVPKARSTSFALLTRAPGTAIQDTEVLLQRLTALATCFLEQDCLLETEQVLALAGALWQQDQQDPSLPKSLGVELRSTINLYLERKNLDVFDVTYDPSTLLNS